jgi:hypothetical protein
VKTIKTFHSDVRVQTDLILSFRVNPCIVELFGQICFLLFEREDLCLHFRNFICTHHPDGVLPLEHLLTENLEVQLLKGADFVWQKLRAGRWIWRPRLSGGLVLRHFAVVDTAAAVRCILFDCRLFDLNKFVILVLNALITAHIKNT